MKPMEYYGNKNIVFNRLKAARKNKGLTQSELTAQMQTLDVHMDQQMISKIESNNRIVTDYEIAGFCKILGVTSEWLLMDHDKIVENAK